MSKAGRELSDRGESFGALDLLEAVLQLAVHLGQLFRRGLKLQSMLPALIGQHARDGAHQKKHDDLRILVNGILRHMMLPGHQDMWDVTHRGARRRYQSTAPTEVNRSVNDRQVIEP